MMRRLVQDLGMRVRRLRVSLDLSQVQLGELTGLHFTAIAHIESGRRGPSVEKVVALAKALGTSTDFLLGHHPPKWRRASDATATEKKR